MTTTLSDVRFGIRCLAVAAAALYAVAGCGSESSMGPDSGSVEVTASTTGEDVDSDGYTVSAGNSSASVDPNGSVTIDELSTGDVSVELTGVASNCSVEGQNPRTVQVSGGGTATTTFNVTCNARTGQAEVTTSTSGSDQDSDGYTVTVDPGSDGPSQSVGNNGSVTFEGLTEGDHEVELSGVANNCSVDGENPRTVTVPSEGTASTAFEVNCSDAVGDLEVSASTSGQDPDSDGYEVVVDGTQSQSIGPDGSTTFTDLAAGTRSVELTGVAANCSVDGQNPRDVDVPNGGTATVTFDVTCSEAPGDLEVSATTSGQDLDEDGYTVTVDPGTGSAQSESLGADGTVTFADLTSTDHTVELTGIRGNCSVVTDPNPRTVTVPEGGTASTTFEVDCVNREGALEVTTSTSGSPTDPDGYAVTVDPGTMDETVRNVTNNETTVFENLDEGDHDVELSGTADNCWVDGQNPRTVSVPFSDTTTTTFDVRCYEPLSDMVVFESDRDGDRDIYVVNPDGTGLTQLTDAAGADRTPVVSPDGLTIAFASERGGGNANIWLMNADGSNPRQLTSSANPDLNPSWSPNGDFVAFQRVGGDGDIRYVNVQDGTETVLTSTSDDDRAPDWDRGDGSEIAFDSDRDDVDGDGTFEFDIYIMDGDGTNIRAVTQTAGQDQDPAWDPSSCTGGTCDRLAFFSDRNGENGEIFTVLRDGTSETKLTDDPAPDYQPAWAHDGSQIVFVSERDGNAELWIMNADGSGLTQITETGSGVGNKHPDWSP